MASSRVLEREVREEPRRAATADLDFCLRKHSLLIVIGRTDRPGQTQLIGGDIERGVRSWDVDLKSCNLNLFLQEFLTHHTASFKGAGHKCLRHCTRVLDTQVLISPSQEQAVSEVFALLSKESAHKLLILSGLSAEESGDLLFHKGLFSALQLRQILIEQFLDPESSAPPAPPTKINLTVSCPNIGRWRTTLLGKQPLQAPLSLHINPPAALPAMDALGDFAALVSGTVCPLSPFDLLPPPTTVGFLKLSRPCCYVFPAGRGDCAFFAVNGFTVLVDGGSDAQACFWKLVRHLDRVDAVLLTHVGTENLPGVVSFLERKVSELELSSEVKDDLSKRLISPELGVVFFNAPGRLQAEQKPCLENVLKSSHQAARTLQLLKKLDIKPQPMYRPQGAPIEPLTLFQKMGVGQLDLYILSPGKNSQEYQAFTQNWPDDAPAASEPQAPPLAASASVSALLVWHPASPQEKVVRVLFPGVTPQAKLLQGLEKLKGLAFLQRPTVTTGDLERLGEDRAAKRTESQDSGKSAGKEGSAKPGKDRGGREEGKDPASKEKGKASNGLGAREAEKTRNKETSAKQKAPPSEKHAAKKGGGKDGKKEEKTSNKDDGVAAAAATKGERLKKNDAPPKPRTDNKTKLKKEAKNDSKTGEKKTRKPSGKEANDGKKVQVNAEPSANLAESKIPEPDRAVTEQQSGKPEKEPEDDACGSKMSTPEDMTADFLKLREETELAEATLEAAGQEKQKGGESGKEMKQEKCAASAGRSVEGSGTKGGETGGDGGQQESGTERKSPTEPTKTTIKPVKVVGFPAPLNTTSKNELSGQLDLTPTEYTLLDGALRHSPPSQSSPGNQAPGSPDDETVGQASSDSRPNSAGHTPYCLSPDDVWCNRATLNRLQAEMSPSGDSGDTDRPDGSSNEKEAQQVQPRNTPEGHANPREKHLSFLSLGSFKDGASDHSPSLATTTTTTTHSMPAEVSSPQSTEVDESLSMSFEQGPTTLSQRDGEDSAHHSHSNGANFGGMSLPMKKPPRSLGQGPELGRPPGANALHFETPPHDVDLCLVSPCEFKHFKPADSGAGAGEASRGAAGSGSHHNNHHHHHRDTTPSESNAPVCTEDCPSTTADGALDSDSDESCSEPSNSPRDFHASQVLPPDPPPAPLRDSPPLPPHPDATMPVPQSDSDAHGKRAKSAGMRGKKASGVIESPPKTGSGKTRTGLTKGGVSLTRTPSTSTRSAPAKPSANAGSKSTSAADVSVYVDLAYIPSGASCATVSVDFFRCVRSSCYIVSGDGPEREELMRQTLDALLEGKASWSDTVQVTLIPTFESLPMQEWYQQTLERQRQLGVTVLGSNSTVAMQDETFPACKIEF